MVGQDGDGISLARLSIHGTRHASQETLGPRRPGHQPFGQDCQDSRHRLQSSQESAGQVGSGQEDGQGHRLPPRTKHPHRIRGEKYHESQTEIAFVKQHDNNAIASVVLF